RISPVTAPDADLAALWTKALEDTRLLSLPQNQRAFLRLSRPIAIVEGTFLLGAPHEYAKEAIETRMREELTGALSAAVGREIRIAVTVDDPPPGSEFDLPDDQSDNHSRSSQASGAQSADWSATALGEINTEPAARLNPKYVFDSFVTGSSNRFAHAAAVAV